MITISKGNSKLGDIPSVSLPAIKTCGNVPCKKKCYAKRLAARRANVGMSWEKNWNVLMSDPDTYWREVEASIKMSRFFRFHVGGDIPDVGYLQHMFSVARRNKHCKILCFTKKYDLVNGYLSAGARKPANLLLVFSVWPGYECKNPHHLPEAHVRMRDGTTTAPSNASECGGNCAECGLTDSGCWVLKKGQSVVFNEH